MAESERDKLLREQSEATKERDDAKSELKAIKARGERLPQELKDKARNANQRIIDLGTQIENLDKEDRRTAAEDDEFMNSLDARGAEAILDSLEVRDELDPEDPERDSANITLETEAQFRDMLARTLGSAVERNGVRSRRHLRESEELVRDMICSQPSERIRREGSFNERRREIAKRNNRWWGDANNVSERVNVVGTSYTDTAGGILVPEDNSFMSQVQLASQAYGGVKRVARTFTTADGRPLPIPTSYSALTEGDQVNENTAVGDYDMVFGEEVMNAYMHTSGRLGMSFQLVRDAAPNMPMLLGLVAGMRIERKEADAFINGTGAAGLNGQPRGLDSAYQVAAYTFFYDRSAAVFTKAAGQDGSTAANQFDQWVKAFRDLKYAVDPSYRASMNFSFVMSDHLDSQFAGATNNRGDVLRGFERWLFGNTAKGMGINLAGMNIMSDYSIPGVPTANGTVRHGWVGDFNWFWIRRVRGMFMLRDPYTDGRKLLTHWIFARACDSEGLFRTQTTGQTTAVKAVQYTAHA